MNSVAACKSFYHNYYFHSPFQTQYSNLILRRSLFFHCPNGGNNKLALTLRAYNDNVREEDDQRRGFLSLEEAGLVEISGLNTHERFLSRLTISSLNLLRVIAEQEGCKIEDLNAGKICDWFFKDKLKREQNIGSAVLQWEDDDPFDLQF